jgi:hypothetical protein
MWQKGISFWVKNIVKIPKEKYDKHHYEINYKGMPKECPDGFHLIHHHNALKNPLIFFLNGSLGGKVPLLHWGQGCPLMK